MTKFKENQFQEAILAAKEGDKDSAREILSQIVRNDPLNARAWYLLSQVVDDNEKAIFCLEQVLKIDPGHSQTIKRIEKYRHSISLDNIKRWESDHEEKEGNYSSPLIDSKLSKKRSGYGTIIWMIVIIVVVLCCLCSIAGFVFSEKISSILISNFEDQISTAPAGSHMIRLRVEGSAQSAVITYTDSSGVIQQESPTLPWETTFQNNTQVVLMLSAQSESVNDRLSCIIYLDGEEWQRNNSNQFLPMCNVLLVVSGE